MAVHSRADSQVRKPRSLAGSFSSLEDQWLRNLDRPHLFSLVVKNAQELAVALKGKKWSDFS